MSKEGLVWWENIKTHETTPKRKVRGSADLFGRFNESIYVRELNQLFCRVSNSIPRTPPVSSVNIKTTFDEKGYINMIRKILEILLTGSMFVNDYVNVTVRYRFLGKLHVINQKIKVVAVLPVRNVHYSLI